MQKYKPNAITGDLDVVDIQTEFYNNLASFPLTGQSDLLYVAKDTGKIYYWNGSAYTLANIPNFQEVTDVDNTTTNSIVMNDIIGGSIDFRIIDTSNDKRLILEAGVLLVEDTDTGNKTLIGDTGFQFTRNNVNSLSLDVNALTGNRNQNYQDASGTIALLTDIPSAITPEQIQDSAFAILTDTPTINLNYDDAGNEVTATVIDNSITNNKLSVAPANTVKSNPTNAVANEQDLAITPESFLGRVAEVNGGNLAPIPVSRCISGEVTVTNGVALILNIAITVSSFLVSYSIKSGGSFSSVPFQYTAIAGQMQVTNGQTSDNGTISYLIII